MTTNPTIIAPRATNATNTPSSGSNDERFSLACFDESPGQLAARWQRGSRSRVVQAPNVSDNLGGLLGVRHSWDEGILTCCGPNQHPRVSCFRMVQVRICPRKRRSRPDRIPPQDDKLAMCFVDVTYTISRHLWSIAAGTSPQLPSINRT